MSNEYLEALGKIIRYNKEYVAHDIYRLYIKKNEIELLENYLTELEQIKNSNSSKALECLEKLELLTCDFEWYKDNINTIRQALIKSQEQEKMLEIIKEKGLDYHSLSAIKQAKDFEEFKELTENLITKFLDYTEEEFNLLKRWTKCQKN